MTTVDFAKIKHRYSMRDVIAALHLDGHFRGKEFVARNPTRNDETAGSFSINVDTGVWKDFATGDAGNDCVSLWRYIRGCGSMTAAADELERALQGASPPKPRPAEPTYTLVMPTEGREAIRPRHPELGEPTHQYLYRGPVGYTKLGVVCRWDLPDGSKTIRPYFQFRSESGALVWRFAGPTGDTPRPLYGLEQMEAKPTRVWLVEGEKTADAVRAHAPEGLAVLSWYGGVDQADRAELRHLAGRPVTIVPDRDAQPDTVKSQQPGMRAANTIAAKLLTLGCRVSIVDYTPGESPHGWDLADAVAEGWDWSAIEDMIRSRSRVLPKLSSKTERPTHYASKQLYQYISGIDFPDQLQSGEKIRLLDTWQNLQYVFECYGISCRSNLLTNDVELIHTDRDNGETRSISIEEVVSISTKNALKTGHINDHVKVIGDANSYHPVIDWIKSEPWDGITRVPDMFKTITIGDTPVDLAFRLFFRWAISAVALVTQERYESNGANPAAQGVMVLVGSQGINKSRWVSSLALPDFVRPNVMLNLRDKDSLIRSTSSWIVEWAEVSGSKRTADVESMRAFVTSRNDIIRLPYARREEIRPRRTVYIGTENTDDFLIDPEGDRRWWTIRVKHLDADHNVDRQQFWAEIYTLFKQGEQWWLTPEEMAQLNANNVTHKAIEPIVDLIESAFRWEADAPRLRWVSATTVLSHLGYQRASRADVKAAINVFRSYHVRERKLGHRSVEFELPPYK